jgi:hypothetical protein
MFSVRLELSSEYISYQLPFLNMMTFINTCKYSFSVTILLWRLFRNDDAWFEITQFLHRLKKHVVHNSKEKPRTSYEASTSSVMLMMLVCLALCISLPPSEALCVCLWDSATPDERTSLSASSLRSLWPDPN